jgi:hypothetical protein
VLSSVIENSSVRLRQRDSPLPGGQRRRRHLIPGMTTRKRAEMRRRPTMEVLAVATSARQLQGAAAA